MKFYDQKGVEVDIKSFDPESLVIARVTKPMEWKEFSDFCDSNKPVVDKFESRGIDLVFCPDWVEFKEWK